MIKNISLILLLVYTSSVSRAADFSECHEYSKAFIKATSEPVISENGFRSDWTINGDKLGCRADSTGKVVSIITPRGEMMRNQLVKIAGPSAGKIEYFDNEDDDFVKASINGIKKMVKDPDSIQFRNVFISTSKLQTLCGEINAKNSYGGFVGFRRFYYTGRAGLDEIENPGDSIFSGMYPKMCAISRKPISLLPGIASLRAKSSSVADEISKLNDLRQKGILTNLEFETQKKKILAN